LHISKTQFVFAGELFSDIELLGLVHP